ncbi:MAG: ATP-dependent helicase, partial [Actinobacteria bacterium]
MQARMAVGTILQPDPQQAAALAHEQGPLLLTGTPGAGKTWTLRERFARLIESGADPERAGLVVRSRGDRSAARDVLSGRLARALPGMKVMTVHGLAHHVMAERFERLGYGKPPEVLAAADQSARVWDLLAGEVASEWRAFGSMLTLVGFADQVRQFLLRAQEALLSPEEIATRAERAGLSGFTDLARFYRRYLDVLHSQDEVDFAGLVGQSAAALAEGRPPFDHLLVDDYHEATFAEESLVIRAAGISLIVAGDPGSHVFSFQGTTDEPIRRFLRVVPLARQVDLRTPHRSPALIREAWAATHESEEFAAVARELLRTHVAEGVPWADLAVVARRNDADVAGLIRALDDAGVPRVSPEGGLSLLAEPAVHPFVLALKWLARPEDRGELVEAILVSELGRLSPATARSLVRAALAAGEGPAGALSRTDGLTPAEASDLEVLNRSLAQAERIAGRSVLDAYRLLWRDLPHSRRLVKEAETSPQARRDLDAVLALSDAAARSGERGEGSVEAFLEMLEGGREGPGLAEGSSSRRAHGVRILTAHGTAGLEFDTVIVVGAAEGNFPSLSRPEPMFDLGAL